MTSEGPTFTVEDLRRWAGAFRRACERVAGEVGANSNDCFGKFPRGQCGNASYWLADFLHEQCCVPAAMIRVCVNGLREGGSHAWLCVGEWTVDITADQFPDGQCVDHVTRDHPFHSTFHDMEAKEYHASDPNDRTLSGYFKTYHLILSHIDHSELKLPPEQ